MASPRCSGSLESVGSQRRDHFVNSSEGGIVTWLILMMGEHPPFILRELVSMKLVNIRVMRKCIT